MSANRHGRMFWRGVWGYLPANIVQGVVQGASVSGGMEVIRAGGQAAAFAAGAGSMAAGGCGRTRGASTWAAPACSRRATARACA